MASDMGPNYNTLGLLMVFGVFLEYFVVLSDSVIGTPSSNRLPEAKRVSFQEISEANSKFNISAHDMIVILHIQKTAGTAFEKHLVYDLVTEHPCTCNMGKRQCSCSRPDRPKNSSSFSDQTWLLSRFSTGWICGLHADWTQLNYCLQGLERLFFVTFLRHPLYRFVSEFRHVQRGATWRSSPSHCPTFDTNRCLDGRDTWSNVTLEKFMNCKTNRAINRQTLMLADYKTIGCRDRGSSSVDLELISSAKKNLREIAFFGLCEYQELSQNLFQSSFNMKFKSVFKQSDDNTTRHIVDEMSAQTREDILRLNHLDVELYEYATRLFLSRCEKLSLNCSELSDTLKGTRV